MRTVVESPQAAFRRESGLPATVNSRARVGDWMGMGIGDRVRENDGRHVGVVQRIYWSSTVVVRWEDTGWFSEVPLRDLTRIGRDG